MNSTPDHTLITHLVPIEDSAFPIMLSDFIQVLVLREQGLKHFLLDRDSFYELLDQLNSDLSIHGLIVNAHTTLGGASCESSFFTLHYSVTRTEENKVLRWEQTIYDHERFDYFSRQHLALKGNANVCYLK